MRCAPASRRAPSPGRTRSEPWKSSPSWRASGGASTRAPSGTSASPGTWTRASPSGPWWSKTARPRCRRRPAWWRTPPPKRNTWRRATRPRRCCRRWRRRDEGTAAGHRQLRLVHLQPGAVPVRAGRRRGGTPQRRRLAGRRHRHEPSGGGHLARARDAAPGRHLGRPAPRARSDPAHTGGLPGPPVPGRRLRCPGQPRAAGDARQGFGHLSPRWVGLSRPAQSISGHPLPFFDGRARKRPRRTRRDRVDRRWHRDGPASPAVSTGRGPVPPRIDPDGAWLPAAPQLSRGRQAMATGAPPLLTRIVESRRASVERLKATGGVDRLRREVREAPPPRDFRAAIRGRGVALIAECKERSPSGGLLQAPYDPVRLAQRYVAAGAAALSVLTEPEFFGGAPEHLRAVRQAVSVPVLCKDFIVDATQVMGARAMGADCILLITAILDDQALVGLQAAALAFGMQALLEVHTEGEARRAVALGATLIGINNRDSAHMRTDQSTTAP